MVKKRGNNGTSMVDCPARRVYRCGGVFILVKSTMIFRKNNPAVAVSTKASARRMRIWRVKVREEMFAALGAICSCCGLQDRPFLSLDHINNDGWKERNSGNGLRLAKQRGWDRTIYQILCYNCNLGRAYNGGICPHQQISTTNV